MAFERQFDSPHDPGLEGPPGNLPQEEIARVERLAAAELTRLYESNDHAAFEAFVDHTQNAMVAIANQIADAYGYCLDLEGPIAEIYTEFLLDVTPTPDAVLHSLTDARKRMSVKISKLIAEIGDVEIERATAEHGPQVTRDRIPKPLEEVRNEFQRIVHVCAHRLDTKTRRVLRFTQTLGLSHQEAAKALQVTEDEAAKLSLDAMELLDTSVTLAVGRSS